MCLSLGDIAPDFIQSSTHGKLHFHEWLNDSWAVLFSHPADFTPICTIELGEVARLEEKFKSRSTKIMAVSVDTLESHKSWIKDIEDIEKVNINYPVIADTDLSVSILYNMIHPRINLSSTIRTVYIIDPLKRVRTILAYPNTTGRNFIEILRVIDSLQLTDNYKVATPVNWQKGEQVLISPNVVDKAELSRLFPKGYKEIRSYFRITPQPNL